MASIIIDYNMVQVIVWCLIAIIAWLLKGTTEKVNERLNTLSNQINVIQGSLNNIQLSLGVSAVQIGQVEVKKASADDIIKKLDSKLSEIMKVIDKIESEEKEEVMKT